jgi:hypothetical protein
MANTEAVEKHTTENKEGKVFETRCGVTKTKENGNKMCAKVKVQWPKTSCKVFPSGVESEPTKVKAVTSCITEEAKVEQDNNNITVVKQVENKNQTRVAEETAEHIEQSKTDCQMCGGAKSEISEDMATAARLRAQRRWRMGLLKRSKLGGIGQEVTGLFPDYFPSTIATEKNNEEDDILTSLKESKQRHRAKLLKQNSIDKIDRELGDRETKLIAGSWLQIYS